MAQGSPGAGTGGIRLGLGYGNGRLPNGSLRSQGSAITKKRNVVKEIDNNDKEIKKN